MVLITLNTADARFIIIMKLRGSDTCSLTSVDSDVTEKRYATCRVHVLGLLISVQLEIKSIQQNDFQENKYINEHKELGQMLMLLKFL